MSLLLLQAQQFRNFAELSLQPHPQFNLLVGENGSGKTQLAQFIHTKSQRANAAFISVNMGAIVDSLFESEMFGHKKGAFTDAKSDYSGRILQAQGGTLFLDELGNLPIATIIISFIFYFIGGYFLYSSLYAAIGAAVDSETDSQQFMLPIIMPLILGVYVGFFTVINDPHGTVATVFSIIPFTSPIVMLMRIPFGVPWWQLGLSMISLIIGFLFTTWMSAKIYRTGILLYGKKVTLKEMAKWAFRKS